MLMVVKGWVEICRHREIGGNPPKVKAAQEAGPTTSETMTGKKLCLEAWPNIRDVKRREEQFPI